MTYTCKCPHCGQDSEIFLEEYDAHILVDENDFFEAECSHCGKDFYFSVKVKIELTPYEKNDEK